MPGGAGQSDRWAWRRCAAKRSAGEAVQGQVCPERALASVWQVSPASMIETLLRKATCGRH